MSERCSDGSATRESELHVGSARGVPDQWQNDPAKPNHYDAASPASRYNARHFGGPSMNTRATGSAAIGLMLVVAGITGTAQQQTPIAPPPIVWPSPPLADSPIVVDTAIQHQIRLIVTKGLNQPWS